MLHVTNGDAAAGPIADAGLGGEVLSWLDVLHDGPVPGHLTGDELRELRARFIADSFRVPLEEVLERLHARDERFRAAVEGGEDIVLWFEHDLFDQLHLLDLLQRLADVPGVEERVTLICIGAFAGIDRFLGLGQLSPQQMRSLYPRRAPVTRAQLELGRRAWAAFCAADPGEVEALASGDTAALPWLAPALVRHLEELPGTRDGLSRTQRQTLEALGAGVRTPDRLFRAMQDMEEAPYMGDWSYWTVLADLCAGPRPLVRPADGGTLSLPLDREAVGRPLHLTDDGEAVRRGRADWVQLRGGIDRWHGGVHLTGGLPAWRWDVEARRLVRCG